MNILLCTSRGRALEPVLPPHVGLFPNKIHFFPGAKLRKLSQEAENILRNPNFTSTETHFYILAGLTDLTKRIIDRRTHYEEVIFLENPDTAATRVLQEFFHLTDKVNSMGAKVILCPVIPSCITKWNNSRLHQKKTSYLAHSENYISMQKNLHLAVTSINKEIVTFNNSNKLATPFIDRPIIKTYTRNNETKYKFTYNHLPDGVHPDREIAITWKNKLITAITQNRTIKETIQNSSLLHHENCTDMETSSPRRSWRP